MIFRSGSCIVTPMPKIRLRQGEEPVEVGGKKLLLGIATPGPVPPGERADIEVNPQLAGMIASLLLDKTTAECFDLVDLRVGKNSQFVTANPIPLSAFATDMDDFPGAGEFATADEKYRELFDLDRSMPGMTLRLVVQNKSGIPARFRGCALYCCEHS